MEAVEEFYKAYAHNVGFSVRIGQKKCVDDVVVWRRFLCAKAGFRTKKEEECKKDLKGKKIRTHARKITRCGCEAMITIKRTQDEKYSISYFHEEHTHEFVTPSKQHLIKSNRQVSEKAKSTLFTCHAASIGTSGAFRLLRVGEGGFEFVGCTKRDMQNYHRDMRRTFKDTDAQMFINNLKKRKQINPGFFFDYHLDDKNRLTHVFWADAFCRKNYALFGEMVSFDSTYSTNQYNMIFCPFTGINHHMGSVFYGAALIVNEKVESYKWVFETFLKAMDGVAPRLMVTDEDQSMKIAIEEVLRNTIHMLCMWHIMRKLPEKVGPPLREDEHFYSTINSCVWGSENPAEFEEKWSAMICEFDLQDNEWFARRYELRQSWIPAYFRGVFLGETLRTTSRSESANSFFNHFIGYKHALVEFWIRIGTALEEQRQNELKADHECLNSTPPLITSWEIEKHASLFFTHEVFKTFQKEVRAARDHCLIESISQEGDLRTTIIGGDYSYKSREVRFDTTSMTAHCTCMLFETRGIPCRHIVVVLRGAKMNELPSHFLLDRWKTTVNRRVLYDRYGNLLEENESSSLDLAKRKMVSEIHQTLDDTIRLAEHSPGELEALRNTLFEMKRKLSESVVADNPSRQDEFEAYIGCTMPNQVEIHPPSDVHTKGRCKRIKGHLDKGCQKYKDGESNQNKDGEGKKNVGGQKKSA
jgi:hypothetical protein